MAAGINLMNLSGVGIPNPLIINGGNFEDVSALIQNVNLRGSFISGLANINAGQPPIAVPLVPP
jgi:hypothetical protein